MDLSEAPPPRTAKDQSVTQWYRDELGSSWVQADAQFDWAPVYNTVSAGDRPVVAQDPEQIATRLWTPDYPSAAHVSIRSGFAATSCATYTIEFANGDRNIRTAR